MFTDLRKSAQSFFAKLILFLLVGMFGLWGIGDVFRNMGGGPGNVATVGKSPISEQEFRHAVRASHQEPQEVLARLVNNLLIEKEINATGIIVGDDAVADYISNIPAFHGKDGQFDKGLYLHALENLGKSEHMFVEDIRHEVAGKLLIGTIAAGVQVPEEMVGALYRVEEEQREASLLLIAAADVASKVAKPTDQEIKAYYDAHPKEFTAPEVRTLSYVALPIADVESKVDVQEDEVKRIYEEGKDGFRQPERREVDDLQFDNEQDANDASKKITSGTSFAKVAAAAPLSNKGKTALGLIDKEAIPQGLGDQVFALKEGASAAPAFAAFRWHIYHVGKIEPGRPDTFEEAHATIVNEIRGRDAQDTARKLMDGFEDALAGGASLEQAAEKIGQKVRELGPVTKEGTSPKGGAVAFPYDNFVAAAFAIAEKDHSQAIQSSDGSYFLIRADSVLPEHVRPLKEVTEQAAKAAMAEKVSAQLEKTATAISEQLRAGKKPAEALTAEASGKLRRDADTVPEGKLKGKTLPQGLVGELFRLRPHESTHAYPVGDGSYMIATLASVIPAPAKPNPEALSKTRELLKAKLTDEMLQRYIEYLRSKYPVTVNAAALGGKDEGSGE